MSSPDLEISLLESHTETLEKQQLMIFKEPMDTFLRQLVEDYVANILESSLLSTENLVVAYMFNAPDYIVYTRRKKPSSMQLRMGLWHN